MPDQVSVAREQTAEWGEKIRVALGKLPGHWHYHEAGLNALAALLAEVEQLREENEQAVMERDSARDYISSLHGAKDYETMVQLADKLLAAEAVVEQQTAALKEIEYACLRQYADWMHFHELAMSEPFKAESEAQMFAQRIQGLALAALRAGAEPGTDG